MEQQHLKVMCVSVVCQHWEISQIYHYIFQSGASVLDWGFELATSESQMDRLLALHVGTRIISLRNSQYRVFINSFLFIPCDGWMLPITGSSC